MIFDSIFSNKKFDDLALGEFFFHPLAGGHSPAVKVRLSGGDIAVVDLNMEQSKGKPLPTLTSAEDFAGLAVVAVEQATIRPTAKIADMKNGASGASSVSIGAIVLTPTGNVLRAKGQNLSTLVFDVATGLQVASPDSAQCLWTDHWQIVVSDDDTEVVLFEWKP